MTAGTPTKTNCELEAVLVIWQEQVDGAFRAPQSGHAKAKLGRALRLPLRIPDRPSRRPAGDER